MSRLRVRNTENTKWVDICQSEWRIRNPSNTGWEPFVPKQGIKARHGSENYWLDIDCISELGDDCSADEYGGTTDGKGTNGSGKPVGDGGGDGGNGGNGGNGGSGGPNGSTSPLYPNGDSGSGLGGTGWQSNAPYPVGYDLPDSDGDGAGDKGGCIFRPGLNVCEGKIPLIVRPDKDCGSFAAGSWNCPFVCPDTVMGRGKGISEFYIDMGTISGPVHFPWSARPGNVSFDIYYMGKLVATTGGQRSGIDSLAFVFTPVGTERMLFVRARSTVATTRWTLQVKCANDDDTDGDINHPRPCHGTFEVKKEGGLGVFEFFHDMGPTDGLVDIHYQMWNQPDKMEVYDDNGVMVKSTGGYVAGEGHLKVPYVAGGGNTIRVRITARDPGTSWIYLITCPGEKGSEDDPRPCSDQGAVKSGGAGVTDTFVDMGDVSGKVGIRYQMYEIPDKLDVFQGGTLVATTGGPVTGDHWLYFAYDPAKGKVIQIRVTGSGATSWSFLHTCPGDDEADISIDSPSIREGAAGENPKLCWTVTQSRPQSGPVTVDYQTGGGTARPLVGQGRILASDEFANPFIAVVDGGGVGRVAFDGGFPKFYNSAFAPPQPAPTGQEVFDSWFRTAGAEFYTTPASIPAGSEARAWQQSNGNISSLTNSSNIIGFISPTAFTSYTFEADLSSTAADDDMIGLVAAFVRDGSANYFIAAIRQPGGIPTFGPAYFSLVLVRNNSVVRVLGQFETSGKGNWAGRKTRLKVARDCNKLEVWCSDFGSGALRPESLITYDLNSREDTKIFAANSYWGFCAQSQELATFSNITLSGIGLRPSFTYLKNLIAWVAKTGKPTGKVMVYCDAANGTNYSLDAAANGFATSMQGTIEAAGYTAVIQPAGSWNGDSAANYGYDAIILLSTVPDSKSHLSQATVSGFGKFVKEGGGLIIITDHSVFQGSANAVASLFNVEFFGSVDRHPVPVGTIITQHGDHPAWEGLSCSSIPAGDSEGAIRITNPRSDYTPTSGTLTFAAGETSKQVCVDLIGNDTVDGDRTIDMTISNASKGKITTAVGTGTIIDDDSTLCKQKPTAVVYERAGGADGAYVMHVQPDYNCAAGNTKYLMLANLAFPSSGAHVFTVTSDDDFELYIDCKKVASGPIGTRSYTVNVNKGTRNVILRYLNVPNCTPGYAGFSVRFNNALVYVTRAVDWKGQANSIGEIEGGAPPVTPPVTPPAPPVVLPPTCNSTPEICQVYRELFNRLPDEAGAQYWLSLILTNNWQVTTPAGYAAFKAEVRRQAGQTDCVYMGGTWDAANNRCII